MSYLKKSGYWKPNTYTAARKAVQSKDKKACPMVSTEEEKEVLAALGEQKKDLEELLRLIGVLTRMVEEGLEGIYLSKHLYLSINTYT